MIPHYTTPFRVTKIPIIYFRIKSDNGSNGQAEGSLGFNNFVDGDVTYTEVTPLWDAIGKPLLDLFLTFLQNIGSVSPTSSSEDAGGFVNSKPLFSGIFNNPFFQ